MLIKFIIIMSSLSLLSACSLFAPSVPAQLIGRWVCPLQGTDYEQEWYFQQNTITFAGISSGSVVNSETDPVVQVWESENMLQFGEFYVWWHFISSNQVVIEWSNPGDPKPTLKDNWWVGDGDVYSPIN
jgi:hypothetical protein